MTEIRATWDVIDRGQVPEAATEIEYDCPSCGRIARLPVLGLCVAQTSGGALIFDGQKEIPRVIRCRHCRKTFEKG